MFISFKARRIFHFMSANATIWIPVCQNIPME